MFPTKGYKAYKRHWEDQAGFMDKPPWDTDKILKLTISNDFDDNLKEIKLLGFKENWLPNLYLDSSHCSHR